MTQSLSNNFRFRTKYTLVLASLWVFVFSEKSAAQTYTDSTIVYLEWMTDPLRTIMINWIEAEDLDTIEVRYRVRGSSDPWLTSVGTKTDVPDVPVVRKTAQLTNLTPNTSYEFRIKADTISHYFRTLPPTLDTRVRFIVTGDVYGDGSNPAQDTQLFKDIAQHAAAIRPHFAVLAGDLIHLDQQNRFDSTTINRFLKFLHEWYKNMVTSQGELIPIVAGIGNHELQKRFGGDPEDAFYFNALFNFPGIQGYRVLDFGNYLSLIVLNSNHTRRVEGEQTSWLQSQLATRTNVTNVFPIYHVPAYPSRREPLPGRGLEVLQNWVPIFEQYNVKFAFEHDNHGYKRTHPIKNNEISPCGVRYFGDGGFAVSTGPADTTKWYIQLDWNARHFNYVDLNNSSRRVTTIAHTGAQLDGFSQNVLLVPPQVINAANIGSSSFIAQWNPVCVANQYRIDVSEDPNFTTFLSGYQNLNVGNNLSVNVTGLEPTTTYYYRVRAINSNTGTISGNSNSIATTTNSIPPLALPATNIASTGFTANWQLVSDANEYRIDIATDQQFKNILPAYNDLNVGNTTFLNVSSVNSATTYYYRVRARNVGLNVTSGNSGLIGLITRPEIPQLLPTTSISSNSFMVRWNPLPRVDQYRLDVSKEENFSTFVEGYQNFIVTNSLTHIVTGLDPQTRYFFRLRATSTSLEVTSENSQVSDVVTLPESPQNLIVLDQTATSLRLFWERVTNTDSYLLDIAKDPEFTIFLPEYQNRNLGDINNFEIKDLSPVTPYYIRIRAQNSVANLISLYSNVIEFITPPNTPVIKPFSLITAVRFTANWESVENVSTYQVDLALDDQFESIFKNFVDYNVGDVNKFEFTALYPGQSYYFRVRAINDSLNVKSEYSDTVKISTVAVDLNLSTFVSDTTILLANGIKFSTLFVTLRDSNGAKLEEVNVVILPDGGLSEINAIQDQTDVDGRAIFTVRNSTAERITYSASINNDVLIQNVTLNFTPIPPALNPATNIRASTFTLHWEPVAGATDYKLDLSTNQNFNSYVDSYSDFSVGNVTSYQISNLFPGITYYARLRAVAVTGTSSNSDVISVTTPQADPNLTEVLVIDEVVLADGTTSGAIQIIIRGSDGLPMDGVPVQLISNETRSVATATLNPSNEVGLVIFNVTNEIPGEIEYTVLAGNIEINSKAKIDFKPVPPVNTGSSLVGAVEFTASWGLIEGATTYFLDLSTVQDFSTFVPGFENRDVGNTTELIINGLLPGVTYYFRVRAATNTITSEDSEIVQVTTVVIDTEKSTVEATLQRVLANGEQESTITIKLVTEAGQVLPDVRVRLQTNNADFIVIPSEEATNADGIATFLTKSSTAGEAIYRVNAGGVELESELNILFLFADGLVKIGHNFPNPFGNTTKIPITIPERMNVKLHVFNSSGLLVDVLADQEFAAGYYEIDFRPRGLASGVYLCRMITSEGIQVEKMLYIK
jgi:phosphodiesterase/alkaline phosphatase D-like protein